MPKKQTVYETADGKEFTDQAAAERHEHLIKCRSDYDEASNRLALALFDSLKTLDGHQIEFGKRRHYYTVIWEYANPQIIEVRLYWGRWDWQIDEDTDRVVILQKISSPHCREDQVIHVPASELYRDLDNARQKVLECRQSLLNENAEKLEKLRANPREIRVMN